MPTKPDWGLGRVVQDPAGGKINVHFREAGEKVLSLKHATLVRVEGDAASDLWLDNLAFENASGFRYMGPKDLLGFFDQRYPGGFENPDFVEEHRQPKLAAREFALEVLDRDAARELIEKQEFEDFGKRAAKLVGKTNLVYPIEKSALNKAIKDPEKCAAFANALYELLYGEERPDTRFKRYCDVLGTFGAARWTLSTYFTFIRYPEDHMLLKPTYTQQAAAACRFDLQYTAEPNRATYGRLLAFARVLGEIVQELKPRDMFDIQGLIWSIAQDKDKE